MISRKATHEQLKRHNRQMLLQAVYSGIANSRVSLAQVTGLAKPTVSDIIGECIEAGLLIEDGHGDSTDSGGKRPRLLQFVPTARQVIGISLDAHHIRGVLSNLDGRIVARHYAELANVEQDMTLKPLKEVINGLVAQLDAPMLCLGVGVPGMVRDDLPLGKALSAHYNIPVYVGNNTELTAIAQFAFNGRVSNLVTVQINSTIEVGVALGGGVYHHGVDIGSLHTADGRLDAYLIWDCVVRRVDTLRRELPTTLPQNDLTYLQIAFAAANGDALAVQLYDELSMRLAHVFASIIGLLRPDHVALAGSMVDLGERLLHAAVGKTKHLLQRELVEVVTFSLAKSADLSAIGAVARAVHAELGIL